MCLSGRRMHVWMLTLSDKFGGEHRKVDSGAYINYFDAQRFYGWEMQIDWDFPLSRYCRRGLATCGAFSPVPAGRALAR